MEYNNESTFYDHFSRRKAAKLVIDSSCYNNNTIASHIRFLKRYLNILLLQFLKGLVYNVRIFNTYFKYGINHDILVIYFYV